MRPLKVTAGHTITELALSPDGRQLGIVQGPHGFRLLDVMTGAEVERDTDTRTYVSGVGQVQHSLLRLAEVAAGCPCPSVRRRAGTRCGPEPAPPPFVVPRVESLDFFFVPWVPAALRPSFQCTSVSDCALSGDHRLAVGNLERVRSEQRSGVVDLVAQSILAELVLHTEQKRPSPRWAFVRGDSAVVTATAQALLMFEIPPEPGALVNEPNSVAPVVAPAVVIPVSQPQPDTGPVPFAVLPGGHRVLVRGEKSRVELRDLATGEVITEWRWGLPRTSALAVAADGLTAAAGGAGGRAVVWDLE
jgi:hypothetical protein